MFGKLLSYLEFILKSCAGRINKTLGKSNKSFQDFGAKLILELN